MRSRHISSAGVKAVDAVLADRNNVDGHGPAGLKLGSLGS
jgi:hypothetical protein